MPGLSAHQQLHETLLRAHNKYEACGIGIELRTRECFPPLAIAPVDNGLLVRPNEILLLLLLLLLMIFGCQTGQVSCNCRGMLLDTYVLTRRPKN